MDNSIFFYCSLFFWAAKETLLGSILPDLTALTKINEFTELRQQKQFSDINSCTERSKELVISSRCITWICVFILCEGSYI